MLLKDRFGRERFRPRSTSSRLALLAISTAVMDTMLGGGGSAPAGHPTPTGSQTIAVTVNAVRTDGRLVAPTGVYFEASVTGAAVSDTTPTSGNPHNRAYHEVQYFWTITQSGRSATFTTPDGNLNLPNFCKDRTVSYGKHMACVFEVPGAVTVECLAIDRNGDYGTGSWNSTIADPDVAYSGTDTICYSPSANFTGAPAGAQQISSSWAAVLTARQGIAGDARILLRGGETYTDVYVDTVGSAWWAETNFRLGTYGTGQANLNPGGTGDVFAGRENGTHNVTEFTLYNLNIIGNYNDNTRTGSDGSREAVNVGFMSCHALLHHCKFSGWGGMTPHGNTWAKGPATYIMEQCVVENMSTYNFFVNDDQQDHNVLFFVGTENKSRVDADQGGTGGSDYGPIRLTYVSRFGMDACYFMNRKGPDQGSGFVTEQPCTRLFTGGMNSSTPWGYGYAYAGRTLCEGGTVQFGWYASITSGQSAKLPYNLVMERCISMGAMRTNAPILAETGPVTIRSTLAIVPDVNTANGVSQVLSYANSVQTTTPPRQEDHAVYNVTALLLNTTARNGGIDTGAFNFFGNSSFYTGTVTQANTVFHAPSATTPATGDAPFLTSAMVGYRPRHRGALCATLGINAMDYTRAVPTDTVTVASAAAINAGDTITFSGGASFGVIRKSGNDLTLHYLGTSSAEVLVANGETVGGTSATGDSAMVPYFYKPASGSSAIGGGSEAAPILLTQYVNGQNSNVTNLERGGIGS